MWKIITPIAIVTLLINSYLLNFLAYPMSQIHTFCTSLAPKSSEYRDLYSAMICGSSSNSANFLTNLRTIGLYHLLVISGSHLVFIEILLLPLTKRLGRFGQIFIFFILTLFVCICNFSPPIVRAWFGHMIRELSKEQKLFYSAIHVVAISGTICLIIFVEWLTSLSFILSWGAAFYISLPAKSSLKKHLIIYVGLLPLLVGLQTQHPLTVLVNWLFAPLLGFILLPASLLAFVLPQFIFATDFLWQIFIYSTQLIADNMPISNSTQIKTPYWYLWLYIFLIQFVTYHLFIYRHRTFNNMRPTK
jgi:competence protein ComEC